MKGHGHGGLPDRDKIKSLYEHTRKTTPKHLTWDLTDGVVKHFYWLGLTKPANGRNIEAKIQENAVTVTTKDVKDGELHLDARLVKVEKPLLLTLDGKKRSIELKPSFQTLCRAVQERGDIELAWTITVPLKAE